MSEIEETAKATQEVAKTVSNALDKSEKFGTFITKYFGTTMEQSIGIFNDKLKYWRWENQVNLISKANQKMEKLGIDIPIKQIPLKLGLPLIEAASLEDDNELQELWANLLVNSSTEFSLERSYISVLEQLSSVEAQILVSIYSKLKYSRLSIYRIDSMYLPKFIRIKEIKQSFIEKKEKIIIDTISDNEECSPIIQNNTYLALVNLARLNCIEGTATHGAGTNYTLINPTYFGAKLYDAVKEPTK